MEIVDRKLICTAKLHGKKRGVYEDILIDTDAAFTVIAPETADFLELELDADLPKTRLETASGIIETPIRTLEKLETAGLNVEGLQVVVHKIPDPAPIKVLLGMNFVERTKLVIDGKNGMFEFEKPT